MNGWTLTENALLMRLAMISAEVVVLASVVWVLIGALRVRTPRLRAMLWLVVLAKPVLGLVIGSPLPVMNVNYDAASMTLPGDRQAAIDQILRETSDSAAGLKVTSPATAPAKTAVQTTSAAHGSAASIASRVRVAITPAQAMELAWAAIVLGMIGYFAFDMRRLRRLLKGSSTASPGVQEVYDGIARDLGLSSLPDLRVSDALDSPALGGVVRPVVLLPRWIAEEAGRDQLAWLLRHELMHYKMRDPLGLAVRRVAEILFFFHPAVWWAGRKWEESMELACDRALLTTDDDARSYAEQLYWVLEHKANRQRMLKAGLCATRTQIGKRIASLLANPLRFPARMSGIAMSGLVVIALIGLGAGLGLHRASAEETKSPLKKDIEELAAKANKAIRALAIAREAYAVDNEVYPEEMRWLTTPICYIHAKSMEDPFTGGQTTTATLKMFVTPDYKQVKTYSVGPDGKDDRAEITYDPTNGVMSLGDIVSVTENLRHYRIDDPKLNARVRQMRETLGLTESAIEAYVQRHKALPEDLSKLIGGETRLDRLPEDLFAPGQSVRYRLSADKKEAIIYSVGPDGKDDSGVEFTGRFAKGTTPKGDIVKQVKLQTYLNRSKDLKEFSKGIRERLAEIREKTGRDNAMIHYIDASSFTGSSATNKEYDLMKSTLAQGWTENSKPLLTLLARFDGALAEVRKGVALDYAANDIGDGGPGTPVPNFLAAQTLGRVLCVEGRYLESIGQPEMAMADYLTALTMGRDYGAPNSALISGLISTAVQATALNQIIRLASTPALTPLELEQTAARLKTIEATQGPFAQWIDAEYRCKTWVYNLARKEPEKLRAMFDQADHRDTATRDQAEEIINNVDRLERETAQLYEWEKRAYTTPYWLRAAAGYNHAGEEKLVKDMLPLVKKSVPNFLEANTRCTVTLAKIGQARVVVALELYRREKDAYPESLTALVPKYLNTMPIDPFGGGAFQYKLAADGKSYQLWSVGPDSTNNSAAINYDPTNGTVTGGDIIAH